MSINTTYQSYLYDCRFLGVDDSLIPRTVVSSTTTYGTTALAYSSSEEKTNRMMKNMCSLVGITSALWIIPQHIKTIMRLKNAIVMFGNYKNETQNAVNLERILNRRLCNVKMRLTNWLFILSFSVILAVGAFFNSIPMSVSGVAGLAFFSFTLLVLKAIHRVYERTTIGKEGVHQQFFIKILSTKISNHNKC